MNVDSSLALLEKTEPLSEYAPGGYHPIHIGARLNEGQYTIVNKLGWGAHSTVWLATDASNNDACVVISISKSKTADSYRANLLTKMDYLKTGDDTHPGKRNLLFPKGSFAVTGPNGEHFCLIMGFEGQTISRATNRAQGSATRPLPLSQAKRAVLDLGNGIQYMHSMGMTHNDLHPANLFLGLPADHPWTVEQFESVCSPPKTIQTAEIPNAPNSDHLPKYLVVDAMNHDIDRDLFSGPFKIADFGLAFHKSDKNLKMATNGPYIVPEQNAPDHISAAGDIWMFGCAIYQFLSGFDLMGTINDPSLKMLHQMMNVLGKPPEWMLASWEAMHGKSSIHLVEEPIRPLTICVREIREGNAELGMMPRQNDFSEDDLAVLTTLLSFMMHFDPSDRPTIDRVLTHPSMVYFQNGVKY